MSDKNADIEEQIRRADKVLQECERKGIDPIEELEKACQRDK